MLIGAPLIIIMKNLDILCNCKSRVSHEIFVILDKLKELWPLNKITSHNIVNQLNLKISIEKDSRILVFDAFQIILPRVKINYFLPAFFCCLVINGLFEINVL